MPLQNRVLPTGEIVAITAHGTLTGNRGIIHRADQTLGASRWSHHAWICCTLDWQGRKRQVMTGRKWTELFFLDEAVALAAGHRPCGYCRRKAYQRFQQMWAKVTGTPAKAPEIDRKLHQARIVPGSRKQHRHAAPIATLPDGTLILHRDQPHLVQGRQLFAFSPGGYHAPLTRPASGEACVLTPAPIVAVLRAGYHPQIHPSAL